MSNALNDFSEESGQNPDELKRRVQETYKDIFPVVNSVNIVQDAVDLFLEWEKLFNSNGEMPILSALLIFDNLQLIDHKGYESTLLCLDQANRSGIIDLDCSSFIGDRSADNSTEKDGGISDDEFMDKFRLTLYREILYSHFCVLSDDELSMKVVEVQEDIANRIYQLSLQDLIAEAGIDIAGKDGDMLYRDIEEYIHKYAVTDDFSEWINIEVYLKTCAYKFVDSTIKSGNESKENWFKLAAYIWARIDHLLGGVHKIQELIDARTDDEIPLLEKFLAAILDTTDFDRWLVCVQDTYVHLKKAILLKKSPAVQMDPESLIHYIEGADAVSYSNLLNHRVLALWSITEWGDKYQNPIQFLRSQGGGFVIASWCHPEVNPMEEHGKESCYYFISDDGIAVVREFNEYLNLVSETDLIAAAMTIIKDVMGEFDMEKVSSAFYEQILADAKFNSIE